MNSLKTNVVKQIRGVSREERGTNFDNLHQSNIGRVVTGGSVVRVPHLEMSR